MPIRKKKDNKPTIKKRKSPTKTRVKSSPQVKSKVDNACLDPETPFHESFPITLEHKDGKDFKRCFFMCQEHCDSYIKRYELKKGTYIIFPTVPKNEKEK